MEYLLIELFGGGTADWGNDRRNTICLARYCTKFINAI